MTTWQTGENRLQVRRGYKAVLELRNQVLLEGEIGFEIDTNQIKIGNGINGWNNLSFLTGVGGGGGANSTVTDYISSFEADYYIYAGYLLDTVPVITRTIDNTLEVATGVTDLPTDWANRLILTYI